MDVFWNYFHLVVFLLCVFSYVCVDRFMVVQLCVCSTYMCVSPTVQDRQVCHVCTYCIENGGFMIVSGSFSYVCVSTYICISPTVQDRPVCHVCTYCIENGGSLSFQGRSVMCV